MAAKRISSIFSMGSNVSDQSSESRISPSIHPARPSREQSQSPVYTSREQSPILGSGRRNPADFSRKSLPNLRPTSQLQNLHSQQSSGFTPPFDPTILPRIEDNDVLLLNPPPLLKPLPIRAQSPSSSLGGRRPASRGDPIDSRSSSRPPSSRPPSRPPSQPASRPTSPSKFRPQTPTARPQTPSTRPLTPTTEAKLAKRRSWMPGKLRKPGQDEGDHAHSPQAWMVTPNEKIPYDVSALANFHRVSSPRSSFECPPKAKISIGPRALE